MTIKEKLLEQLKSSMKNKDTITKNTVTLVRAAILQIEKDNKVELSDEDIIDIIVKQVKQRKDSIEEFKKGDRDDLVETANKEIDVLMSYLPKQLTDDELEIIIDDAIKSTNVTTIREMGKVMGTVAPLVKGKADNKKISMIIKQKLS